MKRLVQILFAILIAADMSAQVTNKPAGVQSLAAIPSSGCAYGPVVWKSTATTGTYHCVNGAYVALGGGGGGSGDVAGPSSSIVNELPLFADTTGKSLKRASSSGIAFLTSGVLSALASTGTGDAVRQSSPTLITPFIASFLNATHDHSNAANGGNIPPSSVSGTAVVQARTINTTAPLTGGGNMSADRTISISITPTNNGGAVALQATAPGTQQTGNLNVSGAIVAGGSISASNVSGTNTGDQVVPVNTTATAFNFFTAYDSGNGTFTKARPAFSDISGSVSAAQLPNPSSSTLGGIQSYAAQTNKFITSISTSGVPAAAQVDTGNLSTTTALGGNMNVGMNALAIEIANEGATGTTVNKIVKLTGAPSTAIITSTSDSTGALGICVANCGTTGNGVIARAGQASCVFDGATTAGNYVQLSSTVAGDCHDSGLSTWPTSGGQVLGRVLSTNGSGGTYLTTLHIGTQAIPATGVGGSTGSTDNAVLRADGTGGFTAQGSNVIISDGSNVSGVGTLTVSTNVQFGTPGIISAYNSSPPGLSVSTGLLFRRFVWTAGATSGSGSPYAAGSFDSGVVFTNEGASAKNYYQLPLAVQQMQYTFIVQDADGIRVVANTGDTLRIGALISGTAGYCESTTIGDAVTFVAINATEWVAVSSVGAGWVCI